MSVSIIKHNCNIYSPVIRGESLYFCDSSGSILRKEREKVEEFCNTEGSPRGITWGENDLFVCDLFHKSILKYDSQKKRMEELVNSCEGKPFLGPNSIVCDSSGSIFFTDSGPFGETSLQNPCGSIFVIETEPEKMEGTKESLVVHPILLNCLAFPSGIALEENSGTIFVAETMKNRILRGVQRPKGVYHFSVFYQFSGRLGPTGICCDKNGDLYVCHFDFKECSEFGYLMVINSKGKLIRRIKCDGTEISGVWSPDFKKIYITENVNKEVQMLNISE